MASLTARVQYPAVRNTKNVFWTGDKYCCAVFFSNLRPEKSTRRGIKDSSLKADDPNNDPKVTSDTKYPATIKEKHILRYLVNELKVREEVILNEIIKHPKRKFLNACQIQKSLRYLQHLGFSKQVIADLPAICFYPQRIWKRRITTGDALKEGIIEEQRKIPWKLIRSMTRRLETVLEAEEACGKAIEEKKHLFLRPCTLGGNIETGLGEIKRNAVELYKLGYVNGFVNDDTPGFLCGSKSKDKRLHLCLYYMELPFDFNGNGIFSIDGYSDVPSSET